MPGPISPDEVSTTVTSLIPELVFGVFNDLITRAWSGGRAVVHQEEAVKLILERDGSVVRDDIFRNHWLNVGSAYTAKGWHVVYDKPGFNESYEPSFTFTKER